MERLTVDHSSVQPPFEQLRTQIASRVTAGDLAPGTKLPTVRQLAGELGLAANTVARAYRELEADGVIVTEGRRGSFVRSSALEPGSGTADDARAAAASYVALARRTGLSREEALRLVERAWAPPS